MRPCCAAHALLGDRACQLILLQLRLHLHLCEREPPAPALQVLTDPKQQQLLQTLLVFW